MVFIRTEKRTFQVPSPPSPNLTWVYQGTYLIENIHSYYIPILCMDRMFWIWAVSQTSKEGLVEHYENFSATSNSFQLLLIILSAYHTWPMDLLSQEQIFFLHLLYLVYSRLKSSTLSYEVSEIHNSRGNSWDWRQKHYASKTKQLYNT